MLSRAKEERFNGPRSLARVNQSDRRDNFDVT
jgi:hypothetical protein